MRLTYGDRIKFDGGRLSYTIRREDEILATIETFGEALAWANEHAEAQGGVGVFWGGSGSSIGLAEWRAWANRTVARLRDQGLSSEKLLRSGGEASLQSN